MAARSIAMAIPQVPINMRSERPDYEHKEYPKVMSYRDEKGRIISYKDEVGQPVKVRDASEEEDFRAEHPEAVKSYNTNPTALRNEVLEDENEQLKKMLREAGVAIPGEDLEGTKSATGDPNDVVNNPLSGVLKAGGDLPPTMTTDRSGVSKAPKGVKKGK